MTTYQKDILERVVVTAVEAGVAVIPVAALDFPEWSIIPITAALSAIKSWCAKFLAKPGTASLATDV